MVGVGNATPQVTEVRHPPTEGHKPPFINVPDQRKNGDDIPPIVSLLQTRHQRHVRHATSLLMRHATCVFIGRLACVWMRRVGPAVSGPDPRVPALGQGAF